MRNMSFFHTQAAYRRRRKTQTRRLGWWKLKAGDRLRGVVKAQGLKKGEKVQPLGPIIEVVSVRPERLDAITQADVIAEGFPEMTPAEFVAMFCEHMNCCPSTVVNRIEFKYVKRPRVRATTRGCYGYSGGVRVGSRHRWDGDQCRYCGRFRDSVRELVETGI